MPDTTGDSGRACSILGPGRSMTLPLGGWVDARRRSARRGEQEAGSSHRPTVTPTHPFSLIPIPIHPAHNMVLGVHSSSSKKQEDEAAALPPAQRSSSLPSSPSVAATARGSTLAALRPSGPSGQAADALRAAIRFTIEGLDAKHTVLTRSPSCRPCLAVPFAWSDVLSDLLRVPDRGELVELYQEVRPCCLLF